MKEKRRKCVPFSVRNHLTVPFFTDAPEDVLRGGDTMQSAAKESRSRRLELMEDFSGVESDPNCVSRVTVRKDPRHGLIDRPSRGRNDENEYPAPPLFAPQSSPQIKKPTVAGKLPIPLKSNVFIQVY